MKCKIYAEALCQDAQFAPRAALCLNGLFCNRIWHFRRGNSEAKLAEGREAMYGERGQVYIIYIQVGLASCKIMAHIAANWMTKRRLLRSYRTNL